MVAKGELKVDPEGFWAGKVIYTTDPIREHRITCDLKQMGSRISGPLTSIEEDTTHYKVESGFFETSYFRITIHNIDPDVVNCATGIFTLDRYGTSIIGNFVGRARRTEGVVAGKLDIQRK